MGGFSISQARRTIGTLTPPKPRVGATGLLGIGCAIYIGAFAMVYSTYDIHALGNPDTLPALIPLAIGGLITILGLIFSWRGPALLGWAVLTGGASMFFDLPSYLSSKLATILLVSLGLGLPLLLLLEIVLTMEGSSARARVVFRANPLIKGALLCSILMSGLMGCFSYIGMLQDYATSPEAATFQTAMIGGLATMIFSWILLARPRIGRNGP